MNTDDQKFPEQQRPELRTQTEVGLGIGVKVLLTVIVLGAVAAGVYAAITLAR
ncbi:MAG: hypothetical protein ACOYUK_03680 [Patescibacteria group bacterium]